MCDSSRLGLRLCAHCPTLPAALDGKLSRHNLQHLQNDMLDAMVEGKTFLSLKEMCVGGTDYLPACMPHRSTWSRASTFSRQQSRA